MKNRVTHLGLSAHERHLASVRAAQREQTLTEYVAALILEDAKQAGLVRYLDESAKKGGGNDAA